MCMAQAGPNATPNNTQNSGFGNVSSITSCNGMSAADSQDAAVPPSGTASDEALADGSGLNGASEDAPMPGPDKECDPTD